MIENKKPIDEFAVSVGIITPGQTEDKSKEYLDELDFLAYTAGTEVKKRFIQKRITPSVKTFIGIGKLLEVKKYIQDQNIPTVLFDDELSSTQLRNIEKFLDCKIIDRTHLILDIFAQRAKTSYARTQVELAQYQYLLPRLTRMWTHLERQRGGIGLRGPGETEIETDRRIIRNKISLLKKKLQSIDKQMSIQRDNRGKMARVALVGYTNVGKSTLMNLLSKSTVFAENKLFATLDTTVRKVVIKNLPFLLTDTVGFIRKLPTQLIESFKSTLDEVRESDLLLHVVDISHTDFEDQFASVNQTLAEIQSQNKSTIIVFNKIDAFDYIEKEQDDLTPKTKQNWSLQDWKNTWMNQLNHPCIFISAEKKQNIQELKQILYEKVRAIHVQRFPYNDFLFDLYDQNGENNMKYTPSNMKPARFVNSLKK